MKITKHIDRSEYNSEEQRQLEEQAHLKMRNYTKRVLTHHYLKAKKQASDEISRLISHWKFDVPGWTGDTVPCPVLHKTPEDLEVEQDIQYKKESVMGRKDPSKMSKVQLQNEELKKKYDKPLPRPPRPDVPQKSNKAKVRGNATRIMAQFVEHPEMAKSMTEAFEREDYLEVFELAFRHDARNRQVQKAESQARSKKARKDSIDRIFNRTDYEEEIRFRPHVAWSKLMDEIIKENNDLIKPDPHAVGHCSEAIKHLAGDLTYDDRASARQEMLECLKSLKAYPQSTAPIPKSRFDECTCIACTNNKALSEVLRDIVHSPTMMSEADEKEIDSLFREEKEPEAPICDEKLQDFNSTKEI